MRGTLETSSSGSRSSGTVTRRSLEYQFYREAQERVFVDEFDISRRTLVRLSSILPSTGGLRRGLLYPRRGNPVDKWFTLAGSFRDSWHYRAFTKFLVLEARMLGIKTEFPTYLPTNDFSQVALHLARRRSEGANCLFSASVSLAVRVAAAAQEEGLDLGGILFSVHGEALTEAKREVIEATGAKPYPGYTISELGKVGGPRQTWTQLPWSIWRRRFRTSVLLIFLVSATTGWGQNRTSGITGTVKDASGSLVVDARIHVRRVSTSRIRTTITGRNGIYRVPLLEVGAYQVTAEKEGFKSSRLEDVILELDREAVVDHLLLIGDLTENVVVSGEASNIAAVSSALTGLVDSTTIAELPLNGRDYVQLATLPAGVSIARAQANDANNGFGLQISISGSRPIQNNFRLDGVSLTSYNASTPGSINGLNLGVDAIQEFSVCTAAPPVPSTVAPGVASSTRSPGPGEMIITAASSTFIAMTTWTPGISLMSAKSPSFGGTSSVSRWEVRSSPTSPSFL